MALKRMYDKCHYLDLKEAAKRLSVSTRTVRAWMTDGAAPLPGFKVRGKFLFNWKELVAWLERHRVVPSVGINDLAEDVLSELRKDDEDEG